MATRMRVTYDRNRIAQKREADELVDKLLGKLQSLRKLHDDGTGKLKRHAIIVSGDRVDIYDVDPSLCSQEERKMAAELGVTMMEYDSEKEAEEAEEANGAEPSGEPSTP